MDTILTLVNKGNDFLWSFLLLILLCGTGIYYTIRLKFIQVRKFGEYSSTVNLFNAASSSNSPSGTYCFLM